MGRGVSRGRPQELSGTFRRVAAGFKAVLPQIALDKEKLQRELERMVMRQKMSRQATSDCFRCAGLACEPRDACM